MPTPHVTPVSGVPYRPESAPPVPSEGSSLPSWRAAMTLPVIPRKALDAIVKNGNGELKFTFRRGARTERAVVTRVVKRSQSSYTLQGAFPGKTADGSWSLARKDAVVVANFHLPDGGPSLEWRLSPQGEPMENEILVDRLPLCEMAFPDPVELADDPGPTQPRDQVPDAVRSVPPDLADDPVRVPEIAVLVVYTPAAVAGVGGPTAMEALVYLAIDETNAALADSVARPRLKLVHHQELVYSENVTDIRTDLMRLRTPGDGYLDEVIALRDLVGADLVSLIAVNDLSCGQAYTLVAHPADFADYAYSVVAHDCVATNYSFSHEIAHNLGCQHAAGDDTGMPVTPVFPYAFGWRFNAASADNTLYRTIMARAPGLRIPYYSNPDILVAGTPAGSPNAADCVRTINMIAPTATEWRATPMTLYGEAVGQPDWIFQSGGDAPWTVQPIEHREGDDALQVGFVPDGGTSWLQTIREGPVQLDFFWKIDFSDPVAMLSVSVDGIRYGYIKGDTSGWKRHTIRLAAGSHIVRWTQARGTAGDALDAVAWIDGVLASKVPMEIHQFRVEGNPVTAVAVEFESIPFQDYVLETTSEFQQWQPLGPIRPGIPTARTTEYRAVFPQPMPMPVVPPESASFRIRLLE